MKQTIKCFLATLACLFVLIPAFAQVTTSGMNGYVGEKGAEALVGATIVATHVPSGTQYVATANDEGRFVINGMRTGGPYKVQISFIGMSTIEYKDIYLKLGEAYEINAEMESSNELDAIIVVGESAFKSSQTGAASSFNLQTVESIPTIDRSIYDVAKLSPQASVGKNGGISFAGSNNRYNSFQIDGAIANDAFGLSSSGTNGGQTGANPVSMDAIEEVQVVVAPFDVRQSGFTGGAINAITKSGTNTVKGTFYSYFNNQDMIGKTPGDVAVREKYSTQLAQTYGFTVGAPIIKNKLFIFASGEYYKKTYPDVDSPANGTYNSTPLAAEVFDADGNSLGNIFNEKMAQAMINHYEKTFGFKTGESYGQHQVEDRSINAMLRLDWNINNNNKLMLRYQFMDAFADQYSSSPSSYKFNGSAYKQSNKTNTLVLELNSRISDDVSNEFRATGVFVRDERSIAYAGPNMYIDGDEIGFSLGTEFSSGANAMSSDAYTLTDNVSIYKGNHNITIGTHNELFKFYNIFLQGAFGSYYFNTVADYFTNNFYKYAYKYADPELTNGNTRWGATTWAAQFGLYVQDEWKPNKNLTVTYGLRADMPLLLNKPTKNPTYNETDIAIANKAYVGTIPSAKVLLSPRIGFRWFMDEDRTMLLRGGAGLFTGRVPFVWLSNAYNNTGMESKSITVNSPSKDFPITTNPYKDIVETGIAAASGGATINTLDKKFKYPQVFRANLGYEYMFAKGWKFTFDALYSKTLNNVFFKNLALTSKNVVYGVNATAAAENGTSTAPFYTVDKAYAAIVSLDNTNKGYTYSFSGQIEKSFDFGLNLMASYTFGHSYSVNDGTSSVAYSNWKYNYSVDTNAPELGFSLFDRPHKVMAMISYNSPVYARGLKTTVALTYEGASGQRYSYSMNESSDFNGDGQKGNSVLYIPTQKEVGMMSWADPADAAKFESFIRNDEYLNSNRGQWSDRYAGIGKFEHHFDLHIAQDFFYDKENGRKLQFIVDFINFSNLLNPEWGIYYSGAYNVQILNVTALSKDSKGNMTPTYKFNPKTLYVSDFMSRWRCQLGFRLTF